MAPVKSVQEIDVVEGPEKDPTVALEKGSMKMSIEQRPTGRARVGLDEA